jgi:hypothetical protein
LEQRIAGEVQRRLSSALLGLQVAESVRARLEPAVVRVGRFVAQQAQVRVDSERGCVRIGTRHAGLRQQLWWRLRAELADAGVDRNRRDEVQAALELAVEALHGEELVIPDELRADVAAARDGLRKARRALRRTTADIEPAPSNEPSPPPTDRT